MYIKLFISYNCSCDTIITYNVAKLCVITSREMLDPRSRTYRKSNQQDLRDNELRQVKISRNVGIMSKYRLSAESIEDNLTII
jgi:hypothetical protein